MASRITPEVGRVYRRNNTRQGAGDLIFDMVRGCHIRVDRVTSANVMGTVVESNGSAKVGAVFNPHLRHFTTKFFDAKPVG